MKKLEDIPKNHPFIAPDGYFEELPGIIQARIETKNPVRETRLYVRYALQYALPIIILAVAAFFYLKPEQHKSAESMLASISTDDLILYLQQTDITTDELLDAVNFDQASVEAIEEAVYNDMDLTEEDLDAWLFDFKSDSNNNL